MDNEATEAEAKTQRQRRWLIIVGAVAAVAVVAVILALLIRGRGSDDAVILTTTVEIVIATRTPTPSQLAPADTPERSTDTPQPTDTLPPPLVLQGVKDYDSRSGGRVVVGEVANQSDQNQQSVKVVARFYDADKSLLETVSTFTELEIVEAGTVAPFRITLEDPPDNIDSYELDLEAEPSSDGPIRVDMLSHSGEATADGGYRVFGEVLNPHDFTVHQVKIVATFPDAVGDISRVGSAFAELEELDPQEASPYEILLEDAPEGWGRYTLQTEAREK